MCSLRYLLCGIAVCAASAAANAGSITLGFKNITNNSAPDVLIGESQLKMTVSMMGAAVNFHFFHDGLSPASITQIYFDETLTRLGAASLTSSGVGVNFSAGGSPPDLPGGNSISPAFDDTRRFTANPPPSKSGVNPGEFLDIKFAFASGDFDILVGDLSTGALRVGIHVQAFADGNSEAFINDIPMTVIPLPAPLGLSLAGLAPLAIRRRRRLA